MPTPTKGARLGGSPAHERLLLANLATALFEHGRITTTVAKAKRLRPLAEKLITTAKRDDLHARRQAVTVVRNKTVLRRLFEEIGPMYASRPGGYTRIVKLGPRKGDNAPMAQISLVEAQTFAQQAVGEAERARQGTYIERTPVAGSTREAAQDFAGESSTAAAVAERADIETSGSTAAEPAEPAEPAEIVEAAPAESAVPGEPVAVPTEGGDTEPADTEPADTQPADTEPADTEPADTEPADTEPADTGDKPVE